MSLIHKNILQEARCDVCEEEDETTGHIFSCCSFVHSFWERIGRRPKGIAKVTELWRTQVLPQIHKSVAHPLILLCCWEIWRHQNDIVFRQLEPSVDRLVVACKESVKSWSCRLLKENDSIACNSRNTFVM